MRRKLQRLIRYQTEELSPQNKESKRINRLSAVLSVKKLQKTNRFSQVRQPFQENSINLSTSILKPKANFRVTHQSNYKSSRNLKTTNIDLEKTVKSKLLIEETQNQAFAKKLSKEIRKYKKPEIKPKQILDKLIWITDQISQEIYSYSKVQSFIQVLNFTIKDLSSKSLTFLCYCFSAQCLYLYGSYSLSIFYSDKALKLLGQKEKKQLQEKQAELELYKTISKIFLIKNQFNTAKHFGYKFLRNCWVLNNFQKQLDAYDLVGKIYHQCQQKFMSIYFHQRMCKGQTQDPEIVKISNYQLEKMQKNKSDFPVYETIEIFIQQDRLFNEMLQDRYRIKTKSNKLDFFQSKTQFYFHTNRSPNRNLDTYRNLERKLIQQKKSKELHFIKPKQKNTLRKIINTFQKLLVKRSLKCMINQMIYHEDMEFGKFSMTIQ